MTVRLYPRCRGTRFDNHCNLPQEDQIPERCSSRTAFVSKDEYMELNASFSSDESSDTGSLPTISEKPYEALVSPVCAYCVMSSLTNIRSTSLVPQSPAPKRKLSEELDDVWFQSHLAEVIELDLLCQGCPYFWKARVRRWPKAVIRDMTDYVNLDED